jgi:hypothetical protein
VLLAWLGFAVTQIPLLVYTQAHPGALTRRFDATSFVTDDMPPWEVAWQASVNYLQDLQVWHYVVSGDVKPYAHTPGSGALLAASLALSVAGLALVLIVLRLRPTRSGATRSRLVVSRFRGDVTASMRFASLRSR